MSLYDTIRADHQSARVRKLPSVSILTTLLGELQLAQTVVDGVKRVDDETVQRIVGKFIKNNRETIATRPNPELEAENEVLEKYLPTQLSEDDLTSIIQGLIDDGATNMGQIMAALKANHAGTYDGKLASTIVKKLAQG